MTALIVIFITLSLMGSVLWVLPSEKDRQRMALRMHARKLGLTVQLTSIDLPDKWDKSTSRHKVVAYSYYRLKPLSCLPDKILLLPYEVWKYHDLTIGWWSSEYLDLTDDVKNVLEQYGHLLLAVNITPNYVSFYWHESGDQSALEELRALVTDLVKIDRIASL